MQILSSQRVAGVDRCMPIFQIGGVSAILTRRTEDYKIIPLVQLDRTPVFETGDESPNLSWGTYGV